MSTSDRDIKPKTGFIYLCISCGDSVTSMGDCDDCRKRKMGALARGFVISTVDREKPVPIERGHKAKWIK